MRAQVTVTQLKSYSLEDLMDMEVTSASRRPEPLVETAGAVAVLTEEDISQIGARSIADALRYAAGMQVARVDGRTWAVTARGFNGSESNKLLVLVDGRTVYTPLFSGVFWDEQNLFLPDLDRIEVIRGPGATLWGANAVNGVVSITTKDARLTQGGLVYGGAGNEERAFGGVRYGGEIPGKLYYRVYAQGFDRDDLVTNKGAPTGETWHVAQGGFRLDSAASKEQGSFTLQGDYYRARIGSPQGVNPPMSGGNILGRFTKQTGDDLELTLQAYYDYESRDVFRQFGETGRTFDIDTQFHYTRWQNHDIVAGAGFRTSSDQTDPSGVTVFLPAARRLNSTSAFVQDEMSWHGGEYGLIAGTKAEYHDFVGLDLQPSLRAAWRKKNSTLWAAVSRAVRTPSRYDEDVRFPSVQRPIIQGNSNFDSETLLAYELGYRAQPMTGFTWDVSLYYNDYDRLRSEEHGARPFPITLGNGLLAKTHGVEVSAKWQATARWRLQATYTFLHEDFRLAAGSTDTTHGAAEFNDPRHVATLRSSLDLTHGFEWDVSLRYVSSLPHPSQPGYTDADMRLAYRFGGQWEISVVGQNLLHGSQSQFGDTNPEAVQVQRSLYGSITWQF